MKKLEKFRTKRKERYQMSKQEQSKNNAVTEDQFGLQQNKASPNPSVVSTSSETATSQQNNTTDKDNVYEPTVFHANCNTTPELDTQDILLSERQHDIIYDTEPHRETSNNTNTLLDKNDDPQDHSTTRQTRTHAPNQNDSIFHQATILNANLNHTREDLETQQDSTCTFSTQRSTQPYTIGNTYRTLLDNNDDRFALETVKQIDKGSTVEIHCGESMKRIHENDSVEILPCTRMTEKEKESMLKKIQRITNQKYENCRDFGDKCHQALTNIIKKNKRAKGMEVKDDYSDGISKAKRTKQKETEKPEQVQKTCSDQSILHSGGEDISLPDKEQVIGITNPGDNTCFLNSLIQTLFHTENFISCLMNIESPNSAGVTKGLQESFQKYAKSTTME